MTISHASFFPAFLSSSRPVFLFLSSFFPVVLVSCVHVFQSSFLPISMSSCIFSCLPVVCLPVFHITHSKHLANINWRQATPNLIPHHVEARPCNGNCHWMGNLILEVHPHSLLHNCTRKPYSLTHNFKLMYIYQRIYSIFWYILN